LILSKKKEPSGLDFELALVMSAAAKADYFSSIRFPV
jgi:hypothetical protein